MTFKDYQEKRAGLMNEAQALIDEGKLDEYKAKAQEVEDLDAKWDATKEALDNLQALSDEQRAYNVQNLTGAEVKDGVVTAQINFALAGLTEEQVNDSKSDLYMTAFAKTMKGDRLTAAEAECFEMVNTYTHTTQNTGVVVPETFAEGIWDIVEAEYPLWADVAKTYVKGNASIIKSTSSTDAAWYDEATATADGTEQFGVLQLDGCELARAITVTYKLKEMAIADFIPFIQRKLAEKMGAGLGYGVARGKGKPGVGDSFKAEPMGIITALKAESQTPQVKAYTTGALAYSDLTGQRALVKRGSARLAYYANPATVWDEIANVKDQNGRPIMVADPINGGVMRIFGIPVKMDDSLLDGQILLGNAAQGYAANVNKDITLETENHAKARTTDYCGYAIVDGGVLATDMFALLEGEASGGSGES